MPRRSPIDGEWALLVAGLLLIEAFTIAWCLFGLHHTMAALLGRVTGTLAGLIAVLVAAGAALLAVRRKRFGPAPTNLTRNDVLGVVFAAVLGADAVEVLVLRGVKADLATLIIGALGAVSLGFTLWVVYRLVGTARPLRAHPDIVHDRLWFDWNHEFPPYGS